ncbi:MAG: exodeoxyribonuclease VII large subunit, partial [Planctomycetes bacterium]|nr:exodeoxyribonuclease VII large subunit [Planctomycetota bacterium]
VRQNQQRCDDAARAMSRGVAAAVTAAKNRLAVLSARLEAISPLAVLRRGYGIVRGPNGKVVRSPADAPAGTRLDIALANGAIRATVD